MSEDLKGLDLRDLCGLADERVMAADIVAKDHLTSEHARVVEQACDVLDELTARVGRLAEAEDLLVLARALLAAVDRAQLLPGRERDEVRRHATALADRLARRDGP